MIDQGEDHRLVEQVQFKVKITLLRAHIAKEDYCDDLAREEAHELEDDREVDQAHTDAG